jgi:hypothetical protein
MLALALREAEAAGVGVRIVPTGAWNRPILAEYDPVLRSIAIDSRVVAGLRAARGAVFANRFVAFAIWHELHHARFGLRAERAAHAYATAHTGLAAALFERAVRTLWP